MLSFTRRKIHVNRQFQQFFKRKFSYFTYCTIPIMCYTIIIEADRVTANEPLLQADVSLKLEVNETRRTKQVDTLKVKFK